MSLDQKLQAIIFLMKHQGGESNMNMTSPAAFNNKFSTWIYLNDDYQAFHSTFSCVVIFLPGAAQAPSEWADELMHL